MVRFIGVKGREIKTVSNSSFKDESLEVLEVPEEFSQVSNLDLVKLYQVQDKSIHPKFPPKTPKHFKIAFVNNWKMACGIATYSEDLIGALIQHLPNFKIFAEINEQPIDVWTSIKGKLINENQIEACWKRGEDLTHLSESIKAYQPDVVLISHEYGIFPNARYFLSLLTQLSEFRTIVILHSVFPSHQDKTICEAALKEAVVHLEGAKNVLQNQKKINAKIHVIPHGRPPPSNQPKLWNFYHSEQTFLQQGFLFPYKGLQISIQATALLAQRYPDIFFTALLSESPYNLEEHQKYYDQLLAMVRELKIEKNVGLIRGFQSEEVLDSYFRTNKIAVYPYQSQPGFEVFGSSGACGNAMAAGLPVITSSIPHFSDLPSLKINTAEELAAALDRLFSQPQLQQEQIQRQNEFLLQHSWENIASKYLKLFFPTLQ